MEKVHMLAATIGAALAWLVGGWDYLFQTLVIFIVIDYCSGVAAAWIRKELSSQKGLRGIAKKIFIVSLVVVADKIDHMLGGSGFWRNAVLYALIANETFSILENGGRMGVPIPKVLYDALASLKIKGNGEEAKHA